MRIPTLTLFLCVFFLVCCWGNFAESEETELKVGLPSFGISLPKGALNQVEFELSYYPNMFTPGKQPVYGGILNIGKYRQYASLSLNLFAIPMKPQFFHDHFVGKFRQYLIPNFEIGAVHAENKSFGLHTGVWFVNIVCPFIHADFFDIEAPAITIGIDIKIPIIAYM